MKKSLSKDTTRDEFKKVLFELLGECSNIEFLILRGHLLIEFLLNRYIDTSTKANEDFDDSKFSFSQKLYLYKILDNNDSEIYDALVILNKLRNQIAHKLYFDNNLINNFITTLYRLYPDLKNYEKNYAIVNTTINIESIDDFKNAILKGDDEKEAKKMILSYFGISFMCGYLFAHIQKQKEKSEVLKKLTSLKEKSK